MQKFLYSVIFVTVLTWSGFFYLIFKIAPTSYPIIFLFLLDLFVAIASLVSIPLYFIFEKKFTGFVDKRKLYRRALKWAFFISFGVVGLLFLKALNLINLLNLGLFLLLYLGIYTQTRTR